MLKSLILSAYIYIRVEPSSSIMSVSSSVGSALDDSLQTKQFNFALISATVAKVFIAIPISGYV